VASFNRPNLTYRVAAKSGAYDELLQFIRARKNEAGIIYCLSRKGAEGTAAKLREDGVKAAAYHAGMEAPDRSRQQEKFLRDEVRVICATIAFGMGINKPNVRFVVHYDLPKNVESYYQETGRAGRDGLPSECLLFFSAGDRVKQLRFIDEMSDAKERERALAQLELIIHYAEGSDCRRRYLLNYFGEPFEAESCNGCDNCLSPRETWDATLAAQKFLSCVYRIQEKSGFGMGIAHVVEVLTGAKTEKIRKFSHETLSTYGIGKEHSRGEWGSIGRELVRLGFLKQDPQRFNTLQLTPEGREALRSREKIILTRSLQQSESKHREGEIECDESLFERLRDLRKKLADERNVPAYVVFSDVSLRHMAREYPTSPHEFARISGVGERKRADFGHLFTTEITAYLEENPRQVFAPIAQDRAPKPKPVRSGLTPTILETLEMFTNGLDVAQIAKQRGFVPGTIYSHLAAAIEAGKPVDQRRLLTTEQEFEITEAVKQFGFGNIGSALEALSGRYEYGHFKVYRAFLERAAQVDK
jgi:ATP-dependent DNA helicase RecQ